MSYSESVKICKGGRLETFNQKQNVDISDELYNNLFSICEIEDGTTLRDIFILVEKWCHVLSPITTNSPEWMNELIREGLDNKFESSPSIEYLEVGWCAEISGGDFHEYISFSGIGPYEAPDDNQADKCSYAIEMQPTYTLTNYEVKLNKQIKILNLDDYTKSMPQLNKEFKLIDVLRGIFWELSFFGSPKNRDIKHGELSNLLDEISNQIPAQ